MTATTILAFDTATRATAVALARPDATTLEARDDPRPGMRPQHATRLLPLVKELLDRTGLGFRDLDRIAVGVGPGTFTGLRIGVATARALAQGSGVSLVGVSTLQSLALNALAWPELTVEIDTVVAVLDARRSEVFAGAWGAPGLEAVDDPAAVATTGPVITPGAFAPETLAERVVGVGARALAIGEGAVEFRPVLERSGTVVPDDDSELHRVTAAGHCRIARHLHPPDPDQVRPQYLRLPDAEIARRAAGKQ